MPHVERPDAWVPADEGAPQEERLDAGFVPTRTFGDVGCPLVSGSYSDFPHTRSDEGVCAGTNGYATSGKSLRAVRSRLS